MITMDTIVTYYPLPEYNLPTGMPLADAWFYSVGDSWIAVVADHERNSWWGSDTPPVDLWEMPIIERPTFGTLHYRQADGTEITEQA
jgi:hypothetical protein